MLTASEDGSEELEDPPLLDRATALGRVLVSQDRDLIVEASRRMRHGVHFTGLIWGPQLSHTLQKTLDDLEFIGTLYEIANIENRVEYLPL